MDKLIKKFPIIFAIIISVLGSSFTELPLRNFLSKIMDYQSSLFISIFLLQMSAFAIFMWLSYRTNINSNYNLTFSKPVKSLYLTIPCLLLILINIVSHLDIEIPDIITSILYFGAFMSTGFFEETMCRGVMFNLINDKYGSNKKGLFFSLIITSVIFGGCHIANFLNGTMPFLNFLNQFFYASIVGLLFNVLYLRCNSLSIPIILHGLIDVTGCTSFLNITSEDLYFLSLAQAPITLESLVVTFIIFFPILLWTLFIARKLN